MAFLMASWLAINPSWAGDAAEFRSHGFSDDERGRYFAFEEFGVQDGDHYPYSSIYIVDLARDEWVDGTPVKIVLQDDSRSPLAARVEAFKQATPIMQQYQISNSGVLMAASPVNELSDKSELAFRQTAIPLDQAQPGPYRLSLSNIDVQDVNKCGASNGRIMGFVLSMTKPDGSFESLHDEASVPASRGCPERYELAAVFAPTRLVANTHAVALIGVYKREESGLNLRYIAVPFSL